MGLLLEPDAIHIYDRVGAAQTIVFGDPWTLEEGMEGTVVQLYGTYGDGEADRGKGIHVIGVLWDDDPEKDARPMTPNDIKVLE